MITVSVTSREFEQAMDELIKLTGAADPKIIFNTSKGLTINLARFTPIFRRIKARGLRFLQKFIERTAKGRARLGWLRAWKHLKLKGSPRIGNGPMKDRGEGGIIDRSKDIRQPFITIFNTVPYIEELDDAKSILERAFARQAEFLGKALDREYTKILRGKSAR